jgi:chromosome segregation protein
VETERSKADRAATADGLRRAQQAAEASTAARTARETELAAARLELEWRSNSLRAKEHGLAALTARLTSLEELDRARAGYSDAARMVLAQANGKVRPQGAIADYLDVAPKYERAVEACLGELLQHVIVSTRQQAMAGLDLIREQNAGRCGFLMLDGGVDHTRARANVAGGAALKGLVPMRSVVKIAGRYQAAIEAAIGEAWIADDIKTALTAAEATSGPVATPSGDVLRGQSLISGGGKDEGQGILAIKREVKELRDRIGAQQTERDECAAEVAALETRIAQATNSLSAINAELHREEKAIVALELQLQRATEDLDRLRKKADLLETERNRAEEERRGLEARQVEACESIARLEQEQKAADERLSQAQRQLFEARETVQTLGHRAAEAKASHATLVERAAAFAAEVARLVEAAVAKNSTSPSPERRV